MRRALSRLAATKTLALWLGKRIESDVWVWSLPNPSSPRSPHAAFSGRSKAAATATVSLPASQYCPRNNHHIFFRKNKRVLSATCVELRGTTKTDAERNVPWISHRTNHDSSSSSSTTPFGTFSDSAPGSQRGMVRHHDGQSSINVTHLHVRPR